jgi:hypothetical protein
LRSEITLVRVFITLKSDLYTQSAVLTRMSVIINFVSVIITLIRVKITLCVKNSLLCVLKSSESKNMGFNVFLYGKTHASYILHIKKDSEFETLLNSLS